jgi:hypothetical protein
MKLKNLFPFETLKITLPAGKTILAAVLILPFLLFILEGLLRVIPIPASLFVPSIDRELSYPEIDIKLSRLSAIERREPVDCFLLGSSMIDFGVDPTELNLQPRLMDSEEPVCFNMALKAMKPEVMAKIADILIKRSHPALIIMGISPVDFTGGESVIRQFVYAPWVEYQQGRYSAEGWWIENSFTYRYWLSFLKYRDPLYRNDLKSQLAMINSYGMQEEEKGTRPYRLKTELAIPDFQFSSVDVDGFTQILNNRSPSLRVVVVEMPVHPDFLPYYIPGGAAGYKEKFILPITGLLEGKSIPFIRTQEKISGIVTADGWKDYLHLNRSGAQQFSRWLAEELEREK